ncbi:thyrotropin-releasing hormone-degrading ectoenzyme-like isoform X2 [Nylanderia fulva]|uniref:thyrotropin-releasing hormone-degrading ectoenzyme-like isoform X2 n=1 Tax=Nylanderia fulva TaxID=613905 RepID=UPI0010FB2D37|nr:thyrotropin-releasing hormone-degrading ectoenzyme-like isoform X2 [Nylanderia fulva]
MMILLKLLLSSGLIFIAVTAFIRNESLCYRISEYIKPMHYDIKLTSFIEANIFYGEYNISINIRNKTQHIYLYSEKLCIDNIVLITNFKKYHENDEETVYRPTYDTEEDPIDISFMKELSPGNYTLNIKYFGTADKGFRIFDMKKRTTWVGAPHFQIVDARQVFPCWHPHDFWLEATFNISLACHNCTTLSHMPLRNTESDEYNLVWKHYVTTPVILTHHATMVMSNYLFFLDMKNRNIQMWCRYNTGFHMKFAKNVAEDITLFFKQKWKRSNKLSNVTYVAIPNFHDDGTIVFGLVFYKETDIIYDKNVYPIAHKIEVAQLVGRKVAQQWFNNMMNNPLVSDFWFKKGLTTLFATYAVNKKYPDYRIINLYVVQSQHYSFNLDSDYHMWNLTSKVNSSLEIPNYIRAPFILRMMQHVLTEEIFQIGINTYLDNNSSHHLDFMELMKDVASTINIYIAGHISHMKNWDLEKHCPVIKVERNYDDPKNRTFVWIENIDTLKIECIPITFTTQTSPDFNNFTHHLLCKRWEIKRLLVPLKLSLPYKEHGWMIFNIQQIGYYRVNYDNENWERISIYLNFGDYTKIHVLNRAQIIDDAFHLMIAGQLQSRIFWDIIKYLHREEDYIAWYPMFKALEYMYNTFPILTKIDEHITSTVIRALHKVLEIIKYDEIDDSDELRICLRQEAARWACFLGDIDCKKEANKILSQHLQDPTKHKLLPWWKEWTYCKEYLACPENTDVIINYLDYIQNSTEQEYQYLLNSFLHVITKHAKNQIILEYILYHFNDIKIKHADITAALIIIIINNVYSENRTQRINRYVERLLKVNANPTDGIGKNILLNSHKIRRKLSIRNNQIKRQRQYFDKFFPW